MIDEKWFTEEKPTTAKFLARADSPINDVKFKSKSKETKTQLVKLMYLCAVSPTIGPIGYYKLNWTTTCATTRRRGARSRPRWTRRC